MLELMETGELIIDNNNMTIINNAMKGLLTAEAAAINSMVSNSTIYSLLVIVVQCSQDIDEIDMQLSDSTAKKVNMSCYYINYLYLIFIATQGIPP